MTDEVRRGRRHVDVAILGLLLTVILQGATAVWWAARMDNRVATLEQRLAPVAALIESSARVDERTQAMDKAIGRMETKLDRLEDRAQ